MTTPVDPGIRRLQRFWEARAREDAARYSVPFGGGLRAEDEFLSSGVRVLDDVRERFGWDAERSDRVLDLGCGAGRLTGELALRAFEVLAVDIAPAMIAAGEARHPGVYNIDWRTGHAGAVPDIEDGSVQDVVLLGVLVHLPTVAMIDDALGEAARVLRPDGALLFDVRDTPGPLVLPGEGGVPDRVAAHPLWRGSTIDLESLAASASQRGLLIERIDGSGSGRCLVLARRERG